MLKNNNCFFVTLIIYLIDIFFYINISLILYNTFFKIKKNNIIHYVMYFNLFNFQFIFKRLIFEMIMF